MAIITILVFLDQLSKWLIKLRLKSSLGAVVLKNIFSFVYVENKGIAFGMMSGKKTIIMFVTIISIILLLYYYMKYINTSAKYLEKMALSLILAGSIGNFIDRLCLGYVIDFIKLDFVDFAIFNIADVYINFGCVMFILYILFCSKEK